MTTTLHQGDCRDVLATLPAESVHCCVTSPPYFGLRDYGVAGQIGLEPTLDAYVATLVEVFRQVRRVLHKDGTLWLNLGDSYGAQQGNGFNTHAYTGGTNRVQTMQAEQGNIKVATGLKPKNLIGIPWRVAFALQADGWYLRSDIIWAKPNPMPESVTDRPTKAHEYLFLLAKSERYYYDTDAIREPQIDPDRIQVNKLTRGPSLENGKSWRSDGDERGYNPLGRNRRSVWTVATQPFSDAHFATFPPALIEPCILAGCPPGGTVLDPFGGAGTTGLVADRLQRNAVLIELNPKYADMAQMRIHGDAPLFAEVI
jgi:DNA modification methylase